MPSPLVLLSLLVIGVAIYFSHFVKRADLPPHLLHHPIIFVPEIVTEEEAKGLRDLIKQLKNFGTHHADLKFYNSSAQHVGEATPIPEDGVCSRLYTVPSHDHKLCLLSPRMDGIMHYLRTGGVEGFKASPLSLGNRAQSFVQYLFDVKKYPIIDHLIHSQKFQDSIRAICPKDKQVIDPFASTVLIYTPGTGLPLHLDAVFFRGATRFQAPPWVQATMQFSGLFQERFIDQIQAVVYFHEWVDRTGELGGLFAYWDDESTEPKYQLPLSRSGSFVDGSKIVHAAMVFRPDVLPPVMEKSADNQFTYIGDDKWETTSNGEVLHVYNTSELRLSITYRARCFGTEEDMDRFRENRPSDMLSLDDIFTVFQTDLKKKGLLAGDYEFSQHADPEERLKFAMLLLNTYVKYPMSPKAIIPFNYCLIGRFVPSLLPLLSLFCD